MKIIGQPESYSDMLERIFWMSFFTGIICMFVLATASPQAKDFLNSFPMEADVGFVKGLKASYVFLPLLIGLASRVFRLHDKVSDLLGLRFRFDTLHILAPMATSAGHEASPALLQAIRARREEIMYAVFYPHAGFSDPKIDKQLVRTAADNWGWFWSATEGSVLFLLTTFILFLMDSWTHVGFCAAVFLVLVFFQTIQWFVCRRCVAKEIAAILGDGERKNAIRAYFATLLAGNSPQH